MIHDTCCEDPIWMKWLMLWSPDLNQMICNTQSDWSASKQRISLRHNGLTDLEFQSTIVGGACTELHHSDRNLRTAWFEKGDYKTGIKKKTGWILPLWMCTHTSNTHLCSNNLKSEFQSIPPSVFFHKSHPGCSYILCCWFKCFT